MQYLNIPSFQSDAESALAFYKLNGFHVEYGVYSEDELDEIKTLAAHLTLPSKGNFKPIMMPHREQPEFLRYMNTPVVLNVMQNLLEGEISGLQSQYFFSPPGTRGFTAHQDNYFVQAGYGAFASAWLALEDTSPENGGLIVYPGSHLKGTLPVRETLIQSESVQDPNAYRTETVIPEGCRPLHLSIPAGGIVFIHGDVIHASNHNQSGTRTRQVLLNTYIRRGEDFRPGRDAKRVEIPLMEFNCEIK